MRKLGLAVNSSCSNTQTASRALQSWAALLGTNWICPDCSITHPHSSSNSASASCHLTLHSLPKKTALWICIHTRFRECGASSGTPNAKDTPLALSRSKTSSISPKSTSPVHPPTQPVLRFHRHHGIGSNFVHAVSYKSLAISTVLTTLRSRQANIGGFSDNHQTPP